MNDVLLLPDLVAIACMALVLIRLRGKRAPDGLHLWITGLLLIVLECVTRLLYQMSLSKGLHATMHVLSLEAYLLAGVAFFQSATGRLRFLKHSGLYLTICVAPHCALLLLYGAGLANRPAFLAIAGTGLAAGLATAAILRRPRVHFLCHAVIWIPALAASQAGAFRTCAYLSLFFAYGGTALAFWFTMPRRRRGRAAVVGAFFLWSLCFVTHPWVAERHPAWVPFAEEVWNLQKFFITVGLLIASLDEQMVTNEHRALHDTLTGLPNRRFFEDRIQLVLGRPSRAESRLLLFNMDLNAFKQVNDAFGHDAGDQLLQQVGHRLATCVRSTDTLARMGGDEFNLLITDTPPGGLEESSVAGSRERASRIADELRKAVARTPFEILVDGEVRRVSTSISIGWSVSPDEAATKNELALIADRRMYADKRSAAKRDEAASSSARVEVRGRVDDREPVYAGENAG